MKFWKYIKYKLSNSNDDNDLNNEIDDKKELDQNHNNKEESKQNIESQNNNSQEQLKENNQTSPNSKQLSSNNDNNYQESLSNNLNTNTSQNYSNESDEQYNQKSSSNNGSNSNGMNNQNNDTNNNQNQDYLQKDFKNDLDGNVSNKVGNNDLINQINNQINQHIFDNTLSDKSKEQIGQSNNDNKLNDEENLSNSKSENNSLKSQNNNDLTNINSMKKNNSNISKEKLNSSINSIDENNNTGKTNNISNEKNQDLDKNIKRNEVINENDDIDINQTSNNLENNSNKNSLNQLSNNQKQRNNNDKSSGKEENGTNDNNKLKRELLKKLSDKLKKYKVKSDKVENRKREKLTKELKDIEESTEEKYELSDQTNQFLDELKDLPSLDERDRGPGYSINTISYTDVPESVIKTLISKFLNQRFCKHNTDLNSQAYLNCRNISNNNIIDANKSSVFIPSLLDKSLYHDEEKESEDNIIQEAQIKLNDVVNFKINNNNNIINNVTLLDIEQVRDHKLKILEDFGLRAIMTDFAILLGGYADNFSLENIYTFRAGNWWLKNLNNVGCVYYIDPEENLLFEHCYARTMGIRPVIPYSLVEFDELGKYFNKVYYGVYPQDIVGTSLSCVLENLYQKNKLETTGKYYTTDSTHFQNTLEYFKPKMHYEYVYDYEKYIRLVGNSNCAGETLSDNRIIEVGKPYWIRVDRIEWLIDHETKTVFSKKLLISGIQFNPKHWKLSFDNSFLFKYLNEIFAKDIIPSKLETNQKEVLSDESKKVLSKLYRDLNNF